MILRMSSELSLFDDVGNSLVMESVAIGKPTIFVFQPGMILLLGLFLSGIQRAVENSVALNVDSRIAHPPSRLENPVQVRS
jgi:hypothetical protein